MVTAESPQSTGPTGDKPRAPETPACWAPSAPLKAQSLEKTDLGSQVAEALVSAAQCSLDRL